MPNTYHTFTLLLLYYFGTNLIIDRENPFYSLKLYFFVLALLIQMQDKVWLDKCLMHDVSLSGCNFIEWDKCSSQNLFFKSMRNKEKLHCRWLLNANCNFLTTNSSTLTMNAKDLQAAIAKLNFDLNSECLDINLLKTCKRELDFWFDSKQFQL